MDDPSVKHHYPACWGLSVCARVCVLMLQKTGRSFLWRAPDGADLTHGAEGKEPIPTLLYASWAYCALQRNPL